MNKKKESNIDTNQEPGIVRREFIKRFGKFTAGTAVGLYVLMSSRTSKKAMCASDAGPP
ncbi:MAG: hypothetical protein WCP20_09820 [Desulfuromonadales bacterium]